ncbi:MAG: TIGR02147 family protein [Deltaproteobacteria bacterium]|nr:TIGR02147 family protein [Deltaproteobacteria bacterium]
MKKSNAVNVFEYLDFRKYLRDYYQYCKRNEYGFSHRAFSRRAGLRSTNYLKLVMDGERNLTPEMADQFARACGLQNQAADYFSELVAFNQAATAKERNRCQERLARFKQYREIHRLVAAQAAYHSTWYLPALRELVAREDFSDDPKWIARTLRPKITPAQAEKAVETLLELGLVERDKQGRIRQVKPLVTTGEGPLGHHVVDYHRAMLQRAADALEQSPRHEREISSLTLCVSDAVMLDLKERIREFRRELLHVAELEGQPERVVQINFQLFPLSEKKEMSDA